ncbi:MAG: LpxL/LpxP family acyltransferase [Gammaproteobacteria bacterium]
MTHWAQVQERGIILGMRCLLNIHLLFGHRVLRLFLYPVVTYYWLRNREARRASLQYLQMIAPFLPSNSIRVGLFGSYLHFISFANALIDKLAAWNGAITLNDIEYHGRERIQQHIDRRQGLLVIGSHLGNLEVGRVIAYLGKKVTVNVLVHTRHAEKFNALLNRYAKESRTNLLQVTEITAATAMSLQDKIEAGEIVVIAGDRVPVGHQARVVPADFLGSVALFPQGPFILASLLHCPVYTLFCLKKNGKYAIFFDFFSDPLIFPRKQRDKMIRQCVEKFAKRLQDYCLKEPLQWFNFYDFWQIGNG